MLIGAALLSPPIVTAQPLEISDADGVGAAPVAPASLDVAGNVPAQPAVMAADDGAPSFDLQIAAGSLAAALDQLRNDTGGAIVYSRDQVGDAATAGLSGRYSIAAALAELLRGTRLTFSADGRGTLVVRPQNAAAKPRSGVVDGNVEEVIVTAQKREEKAKDVAASLTALSGNALDKVGARSISDYAAYVPGMNFVNGQGGLGLITLRGVTTGMSQSSATVGTYVDETPYTPFSRTASGTTAIPDVDTFDVSRVEVLRGPQGTLYGAGSMGGLLKYVTTPPSFDGVHGRIEIEPGYTEGGDWNVAGKAMLNLPLADSLALRTSVFGKRYDGYIDDVGTGTANVNTSTVLGGRASLLFQPTDELTLRLSSLLQTNEAGGIPIVDVDAATQQPLYGDLTQSRSVREKTEMDFQIHNLAADWDLGWASFTSSTSYAKTTVDTLVDYSEYPDYGTLVQLISVLNGGGLGAPLGQTPIVTASANIDFRKFTQEFRLTSPNNRELEWIVGGFYTREETETGQDLRAYEREGAIGNLSAPAQRPLLLSVPSDYEEYAGFATLDYYFTERLDVSLGVRVTRNDQTSTMYASGALWDITQLLQGASSLDLAALLEALQSAGSDTQTQSSSASADRPVTYRVAPRWRITDEVTLYAAAASGYRPGGPNMKQDESVPESFGPDTLWSYEAGFKSQFRNFALDLVGFYIDWSDIQLSSTSGGFTYLANGGEASSRGAELSLAWRPFTHFSTGLNGAYTRAILEEDAPDVGGRSGDVLPTVARWSGSMVADYTVPLSGNWVGTLGASWRYLGKRNSSFSQSENKPNLIMDAYQALNLRAGLLGERWGMDLFVNNVFDERAAASIDTTLVPDGGPARSTLIMPLTAGLRIYTTF